MSYSRHLLVIPYTKVTRGTWHEAPFFEEFLAETVPGSSRIVFKDVTYAKNMQTVVVGSFLLRSAI